MEVRFDQQEAFLKVSVLLCKSTHEADMLLDQFYMFLIIISLKIIYNVIYHNVSIGNYYAPKSVQKIIRSVLYTGTRVVEKCF